MEEVSKSDGERTPARGRKTIAARVPHEDFQVLRDLATNSHVSLDHLVTSVLAGLANALRNPPQRGPRRRSPGTLPPPDDREADDQTADEKFKNSP